MPSRAELRRLFPDASEAFLDANERPADPGRCKSAGTPTPLRVAAAVRKMAVSMSEADFQALVVGMAESAGWQWRHITRTTIALKDGREVGDHDARGLPDLIMWRGSRWMARELKTEEGAVRPSQTELLGAWAECGLDVGVWRPRDMERILAELA